MQKPSHPAMERSIMESSQKPSRPFLSRLVPLTLAASLLALGPAFTGAAQVPAPLPRGGITNRLPRAARPSFRTNAAPIKPGTAAVTNTQTAKGSAAKSSDGTNAVSGLSQKFSQFQSSPLFLPAVAGLAALLIGLLVLRLFGSRKGGGVKA